MHEVWVKGWRCFVLTCWYLENVYNKYLGTHAARCGEREVVCAKVGVPELDRSIARAPPSGRTTPQKKPERLGGVRGSKCAHTPPSSHETSYLVGYQVVSSANRIKKTALLFCMDSWATWATLLCIEFIAECKFTLVTPCWYLCIWSWMEWWDSAEPPVYVIGRIEDKCRISTRRKPRAREEQPEKKKKELSLFSYSRKKKYIYIYIKRRTTTMNNNKRRRERAENYIISKYI